MDMLVNLYRLPEYKAPENVKIARVMPPDRHRVLKWVREQFGERDGACIGISCYDATARGLFGPIGVAKEERGTGVGRALLMASLLAMREAGYGYAVIGWCDEAARFYEHAVGAIPIPGSEPENTAYGRMIRFS